MPTTLTGSTATDPTTAPQVSAPASGDTVASGTMDTAMQKFLDGIAWLRNSAALLAGATFTGPVNVPTPSAAAHAVRKDYVDTWTANEAGVSAGTGWSLTKIRLRKAANGLIYLSFQAAASGTATTAVATIASGYRPWDLIACAVHAVTGAQNNADISSVGAVTLKTAPASTDVLVITASYVAEA